MGIPKILDRAAETFARLKSSDSELKREQKDTSNFVAPKAIAE